MIFRMVFTPARLSADHQRHVVSDSPPDRAFRSARVVSACRRNTKNMG
jgi:hypothetical protein